MRFKHVLLEMSRASDNALGATSDDSLIYNVSEFFKKSEHQGKKPTYLQLKKYMESKGFDWERVAKFLNVGTYAGPAHISPYVLDKFKDKLPELEGRVEDAKDKYDYLIDEFWEFYNAKANGKDISSFLQDKEFSRLIDLFKRNPEKAQEVFGNSYGKAKRWLAPYIVDEYESSPAGAIDAFWDWHRAKKAGNVYKLDRGILERLAELLEMPDAVEIIGNKGLFFYVAKEVEKQLGIKILGPEDESGLQKELKRIMRALDDPKYIDQIEREEKRRLEMGSDGDDEGGYFGSFGGNFGGFAIPVGILKKIVAVAAEPGSVDKTKVGKVDKQQVRECYKYCMNQLNRKFHVGEKGAFDGTLQEFYDKFKIVFVRGYNIRTLFKIFDEVTTYMVEQLDKTTAEYWKNKEDIEADMDFNEAKKVLAKAGYKLITENDSRDLYRYSNDLFEYEDIEVADKQNARAYIEATYYVTGTDDYYVKLGADVGMTFTSRAFDHAFGTYDDGSYDTEVDIEDASVDFYVGDNKVSFNEFCKATRMDTVQLKTNIEKELKPHYYKLVKNYAENNEELFYKDEDDGSEYLDDYEERQLQYDHGDI